MSRTKKYLQRKAIERIPAPALNVVGKAVLQGVDKAVEERWERAKRVAAEAEGDTVDERVRSISKSFRRELSTMGAASGAVAAAPGLGTSAAAAALVADLGLDATLAAALLAAMQSKSETDIIELLPAGAARDLLVRLPTLMGGASVFADARSAIGSQHPKALAALDELEKLAAMVNDRCQSLQLRFDLAELAGFGYHNGPLFSAYHPQVGNAIARGGRYDNLGEAFGSSPRAATGFDVNLQPLLDSAKQELGDIQSGIWVSAEDVPAARSAAEIQRLRAAGHRVVVALTADELPPAGCTEQLIQNAGTWSLQPLTA